MIYFTLGTLEDLEILKDGLHRYARTDNSQFICATYQDMKMYSPDGLKCSRSFHPQLHEAILLRRRGTIKVGSPYIHKLSRRLVMSTSASSTWSQKHIFAPKV